jgi:protein-S-isoprenylcysteine O-methyltransferase Ste14
VLLRVLSVVAFAAMVGGLVGLYYSGALFAHHALVIAVQVAAFALMVAARITFGRRSFYAAANPTAGDLVTAGPYAYVRHPIYAAIIYFIWAGALDHFSWRVLAYAELVTAGAFTRMHIEEYLLARKYPEYRAYKSRVRRIVPFLY